MSALQKIIDTVVEECVAIHALVGKGLYPAVYKKILYQQLTKQGLFVQQQVPLSVNYQHLNTEVDLKAEFIVENAVVCEIKCLDAWLPAHKKGVATFLKLANIPIGLLINFKEDYLKNGIVKLVNQDYQTF